MKTSHFVTVFALSVFSFHPLAQADTAVAHLKGTSPDSDISGKVTFEEIGGGLQVVGDVSNVTPGKHGFHIHENGSCEDKGNAAGAHFNPNNAKHGLLSKDTQGKVHAGDLGNVIVQSDSTGTFETFAPGLTIADGTYGIVGKAVILHEKEDDFGQPAGNAGGRVACGIIEKE